MTIRPAPVQSLAAALAAVANVELHPEYANGWDSLGEGLAEAGGVEEAIAAYDRALSLDPDGPTGANACPPLDRLRAPTSN